MKINDEQFRDMLIYAFRYALGRATFASKDMSEIIWRNRDGLSNADRDLFCREIRDAIERDHAGHECDKKAWAGLLADLEAMEK